MKMRTVISLLVVLSIVSILTPLTSSAQDSNVYMYWTDSDWRVSETPKIQRANLDGSNVRDLVTGVGQPIGIALDLAAGKMYWTGPNHRDGMQRILRANLDGTSIETLASTRTRSQNIYYVYYGIALDTTGGKMYWVVHSTANNANKVQRANLDGTGVEDLVIIGRGNFPNQDSGGPRGIALDLSRRKMYWSHAGAHEGAGKIQRANLDGSNIEDIITELPGTSGLTLDSGSEKIYWTERGKVRRANFDGSNIEDVLVDLVRPVGIALDNLNGKMYWAENQEGKIQRANLDGSNVEDLVTNLGKPHSIALGIPQPGTGLRFSPNVIADQNFTVDIPVDITLPSAVGGTAPYTYNISAPPVGLYFDPTTRQIRGTPTILTSAHPVTYAVTDAAGHTASLTFTITVQTTYGTNVYMYWTDAEARKIQRANLDGTNIQDLVTTGLVDPESIALDLATGKMYWTDTAGGRIQRANLDGTNVEDIPILGLSRPDGIALDLAAGKIYWSDNGTDKIRRANLDGTNAEDLVVTGVADPEGLALDLAAGKIYWSEWAMAKIRRANLDGTNPEDVLTTGLINPDGIALDVVDSKMYWIDAGRATISRANLNGTNVEALVTAGLDRPDGIALDVVDGKMYWTDFGTDKIQRANLDGSHVEDLITTGLSAPKRIALGIPQVPSGLRFDPNVVADQTFTVGTAVSLTLPMAAGGSPPYTYSLAPTLPAGLYFDPIANGPGHIGGTPTAILPATPFTYTATDVRGASASLTFTITIELDLDVNGDGKVDVLDLVWVAVSYGMRGDGLRADVNVDGVVNVQDLVAVAGGVDAAAVLPAKVAEEVALAAEAAAAREGVSAGAPGMRFSSRSAVVSGLTAQRNVAAALADARTLGTGDVRLGKWLPLLERLLQMIAEMKAIPEATALLPNYPNPFNPETWIPYHLAQAANVTLTIYDVRGDVVRTLRLGHQPAGVYQSRGRAAYWGGRNQIGEQVASGLYFYTLAAGEFTATRKMLIAK